MDNRIKLVQGQLNRFMEEQVIPHKGYSRFSDISEGLGYTIFPIPNSLHNNVAGALELLKKTKDGYLTVEINNIELQVRKTSSTEKNLTLVVSQGRTEIDTEQYENEFVDVFNVKEKVEDKSQSDVDFL